MAPPRLVDGLPAHQQQGMLGDWKRRELVGEQKKGKKLNPLFYCLYLYIVVYYTTNMFYNDPPHGPAEANKASWEISTVKQTIFSA